MDLRALLRIPDPKPATSKALSGINLAPAAYSAHWVPRALGAGKNWRSIAVDAAGFDLVRESGTLVIPFAKIRDIRLNKGWLFGTVTLDLDDGSVIALDGFRLSEAQHFHAAARDAIGAAAAIRHLQSHHDVIHRLDAMVAELTAASRFVAHSEIERVADEIAPHLFALQICSKSEVDSPFSEIASRLITFLADRQTTRDANNERFLTAEASACAQLFDTLERMPLTATQRRAALVDEDNTLVLAGAGSGKTSLITAKVAHLIHRGIAREADVLLLAFPSEIADDPVLNLVISEPEAYPNAEERRLFYVALTRAREAVYITVNGQPSSFVRELLADPTQVTLWGISAMEACPACHGGTLRKRESRFGPFVGCSNHPYCDYTRNIPQPRPNAGTDANRQTPRPI